MDENQHADLSWGQGGGGGVAEGRGLLLNPAVNFGLKTGLRKFYFGSYCAPILSGLEVKELAR